MKKKRKIKLKPLLPDETEQLKHELRMPGSCVDAQEITLGQLVFETGSLKEELEELRQSTRRHLAREMRSLHDAINSLHEEINELKGFRRLWLARRKAQLLMDNDNPEHMYEEVESGIYI